MRDDRGVSTQRTSRHDIARTTSLALLAVVAFVSIACVGTSGSEGVVVRPVVDAARAPSTAPPAAIAPAPVAPAPPPATVAATVAATAAPTAVPTLAPTPVRTPTAAPQAAAPRASAAVKAPTAGRWIEVDVSRYVVRLMEGERVVRELGPVGVGREIDTGIYESTQTGLFKVHNKIADRTYDAPYNTYIQWWVGFDIEKANGFHSLLQDKDGNIVDASTGRVSNGCIRVGEADAVFRYAEVGMPVLVHA